MKFVNEMRNFYCNSGTGAFMGLSGAVLCAGVTVIVNEESAGTTATVTLIAGSHKSLCQAPPAARLHSISAEVATQCVLEAGDTLLVVRFLLKNLHFLLKDVDFLSKNVDFLLKNVDFILKGRGDTDDSPIHRVVAAWPEHWPLLPARC